MLEQEEIKVSTLAVRPKLAYQKERDLLKQGQDIVPNHPFPRFPLFPTSLFERGGWESLVTTATTQVCLWKFGCPKGSSTVARQRAQRAQHERDAVLRWAEAQRGLRN